jgi:UDP-glucose 4-epimerase
MKLVVTGGAGFIGSHLVDRLVSDGHDVTVLDDLSTGKIDNLRQVWDAVRFIEGDIRDGALLAKAVEGADCVFHLAALGSVPRSIEDPAESNSVNVDGTLGVLVAARDAAVDRVIFASSSSVYGDTPELPKHEEMPVRPASPYGVSKYAGELYCRVFWGVYGLRTISLRYFNVFGPRQDPDSQYAAVIPRFTSALLDGRSPTVYGDGEQSRDFTYVANVVEANVLAMRAVIGFGEAFNIAAGGRVTVNELATELIELTGSDALLQYAPVRPGEIRDSWASIARASSGLGYKPGYGFKEGIRATVAWHMGRNGGARAESHQGIAGSR